MILWSNTRVYQSKERDALNAEVALIAEGMPLVTAVEGGVGKVRRSTGATTDNFAGVAMTPRKALALAKGVEVITSSSVSPIVLKKLVSGFAGAFRNDTGALIAVTASAASTTNIQQLVDATTGFSNLTFDSTLGATLSFTIVYSYAIAPVEESGLYGTSYAGISPTDFLGKVSVLWSGEVWTNNFLQGGNFYAGNTALKAIATGQFAEGLNAGAGIVIANAEILQLPTADIPYMGILLK